jgi:uncharacterized protein YueI
MKRKTIKAIINKKVADFIGSVNDPILRKQLEDNIIVTGGCITSMLLNEEVNDFDIYFRNRETALMVAKHYIELAKEKFNRFNITIDETKEDRVTIIVKNSGVVEEKNEEIHDEEQQENKKTDDTGEKYRVVHISSNAITLSHGIQLVLRFYGEPEEIHANYDFVHTMCYYSSWDNKLELPAQALEAIITKELIYQGSKYPLCSMIRTRKFIKRGWSINAGQYVKMAFQLNELDLTDIDILEEQLMGVDALYFILMISQLRNQKEKDPNFSFDSSYIATIVNKIF